LGSQYFFFFSQEPRALLCTEMADSQAASPEDDWHSDLSNLVEEKECSLLERDDGCLGACSFDRPRGKGLRGSSGRARLNRSQSRGHVHNRVSLFTRRRGARDDGHPRRQSTPRRRLVEAQLADKSFASSARGEQSTIVPPFACTPGLAQSASCVLDRSSFDKKSATAYENLSTIAATAREVADFSLRAGTRNVAIHTLHASKSARDLPTYTNG